MNTRLKKALALGSADDHKTPLPKTALHKPRLSQPPLPDDASALVGFLAHNRVLSVTPPQDMHYWVNLLAWSQKAFGAYADNTTRQRAQDWLRFVQWCGTVQRQPLPASADTVRLYILAHVRYIERVAKPKDILSFIGQLEGELDDAGILRAEKPVRMASLSRYINSIAVAHRGAEATDPTVQGPAQLAKRLARRISDGQQQQRDPIYGNHLDAMLALCCNTLREKQDVVIVALAYETGQRASAIADIAVEDVTWLPDQGARVKIWRHKTTQINEPIVKMVSEPVAWRLKDWLQEARIGSGPVFRALPGRRNAGKDLSTSALSPRAVAAAMKRCMARIGVEELQLIGGHSTRIGGALDIAAAGGDLQDLMRHGHWKSVVMPLRYTQRLTDAKNPIHDAKKPPAHDD